MKKYIKLVIIFIILIFSLSSVFAINKEEKDKIKLVADKFEQIITKKGENYREKILLALKNIEKKYEKNEKKLEIINELYNLLDSKSEDTYINEELGIKFKYNGDGYKGKIKIQENKIIDTAFNSYTVGIEVFTKKDTQNIEDAILDIIKNNGKNIKNCKVVNNGLYRANEKFNVYTIELVDDNISYTKEELEEIKKADEETKQDGSPFNGEWKKKEIYNNRLIENCTEYADPLGLSTSTTTPSKFIYNNNIKNKFIFLPGLRDQSFYEDGSIEILE